MKRDYWLQRLKEFSNSFRVVGLLGPRQCGKTTLARAYISGLPDFDHKANYFDLEDPGDLARLENPKTALSGLQGTVVIDEVQRRPSLFEILRVLADRPGLPARFLVLGSASPDLIRQSSETLAGRIGYLELTPFSLSEVGSANASRLHVRGGYPESYLAKSEASSFEWRTQFIRTFLEREIPMMGFGMSPATLGRFWQMLSHYHGQLFNASEIGRSMGISHVTVGHYVEALAGTYMVRRLSPWFENIGKRQVRAPKIYFRDSGLFHGLLGVRTPSDLLTHPRLGASWEGFAFEETCRCLGLAIQDVYYWAVHGQAELDMFAMIDGRRHGFEFKYADAPRMTNSIRTAKQVLGLSTVNVVYPGDKAYELAPGVRVWPIGSIDGIRADLG